MSRSFLPVLMLMLLVTISPFLAAPYCSAAAPTVGTITPASGSSNPNVAVTFTTTFNDTDGWQNIQYVYFLVNSSTSGANCSYLYYNQNTNKLYLRNDANTAWLGGYAPASSYIIENSYVKLSCSQTTVTGSGSMMTVKWNITFKSPFVNTTAKKTYLYVRDDSNAYQGWVQKGTWTIGPNSSPTVGTITPSSGSSLPDTAVTFTTTYADPNGWQNLQLAYLLINTSASGLNCFYTYYNQNTNKLYLRNEPNTAWLGGYAPGSAYTIENSYAKLDCSKTTISGSGTTLTVNWNITFKAAFASTTAKKTYLYVKDDSNAYQGWIQKGTWTVQVVPPPTVTITEPVSGAMINAEP